MQLPDLLYLMYKTPDAYQTIQLTWEYKYQHRGLNTLMQRWADSRAKNSFVFSKSLPDDTETWSAYKYTLRQEKNDQWRLDSHQTNHIQITQNNGSFSILTEKKLITNNPPQNIRKINLKLQFAEAAGQELQHFQFLSPAFLLNSHDLQIINQAEYIDRAIIEVEARYKRNADFLFEPFFWATADKYRLSVDADTGILLRYSAVVDDEEIAVLAVEDIEVNQPINPTIFELEHILASRND